MTKATVELANGTKVTIEGSTEDVKQLLAFYGQVAEQKKPMKSHPSKSSISSQHAAPQGKVDLSAIIAQIKNSEDSDAMAEKILDRSSAVDRILLPLYVIHEHMSNSVGLTSGDISEITRDLGTPISIANVAHALSGSARRYVVGDKVRKKGVPVRYKLSRKGLTYIKSLIVGNQHASKK
jgi:hypothetical protein